METTYSDQEALSHRLDQLPEHVGYHSKRGFATLSTVNDKALDEYLDAYFAAAEGGDSLETEPLARILGLDDRTTSDVVLATSLTLGAITDLNVSADDFVSAGSDRIFDSQARAVAGQIAKRVIDRRETLRGVIERSSIANAILPTLQSTAVELDLRLRFDDKDEVTSGALVVIVGIRTDIEDDFYFQLTPEHLKRFTKQLEGAERRLNAGKIILDRLEQ
jgi:hypothetical protein